MPNTGRRGLSGGGTMNQEDINEVISNSMEPWQKRLAARGRGEDYVNVQLYQELKYALECIRNGCMPGDSWVERAKTAISQAEGIGNKMTNQDKVRSRYPYASAEQERADTWCVWDISRNQQKRLNEKHWPETYGCGLFGLGRTESEAWADAVRTIEQREGRKLPLP